jgi:hypothetical protein
VVHEQSRRSCGIKECFHNGDLKSGWPSLNNQTR